MRRSDVADGGGRWGRMGRLARAGSVVLIATAMLWSPASLALAGDGKAAEAGATPATDDPAVAYAQVEAQVRGHLRDKARDALKEDVKALAKTVAATQDAKWKVKYEALVGLICQTCTDDGVQKECIVALGDMKDPDMFRYVRPFLAQPNVKETPPLLEDAITAAGKMVSDDAVLPLMKLVKDSKVMTVAVAALKAFSTYGASKRMRVQIVKDLISSIGKDQPGVGNRWDNSQGDPTATARTKTGEESRARWSALSGELVRTLNAMTSLNAATAEDWFSLYDKYKNNLNAIFPTGK
jgi:hypothetical protein